VLLSFVLQEPWALKMTSQLWLAGDADWLPLRLEAPAVCAPRAQHSGTWMVSGKNPPGTHG
jgi:hypothetical protein